MRNIHLAILVPVIVTLTACGGGGGSGSGNVRPVVDYSGTLVVNADHQASSLDQPFTFTTAGTVVTPTDGTTGTGSVTLGIDLNGDIDGLSITSAAGQTYSASGTDKFVTTTIGTYGVIAVNGDDAYLFDNQDWNYQSFGYWSVSDRGVGSAFSTGYPTPSTSLPTTGTASYTGLATGYYVDGAGSAYYTGARATASVDFAARSASFSTSGTYKGNMSTGVVSADNNLNLSGTLTYAAGTNALNGNISSVSGLAGDAQARFYGGGYQEIGGTYSTTPAGKEYMVGAFGMK